MTVLEDLSETGKSMITTLEKFGYTLQLRIETVGITTHEFKQDYSIRTKCYEIGAKNTSFRTVPYYELENNGTLFQITEDDVGSDGTVELSFACVLTDRGDNDEVIVPDEPYDTGSFKLEPGVYRVYDWKIES